MKTKPIQRQGRPASAESGHSAAVEVSYRSAQPMWGLWLILPLTAVLAISVGWNAPQPPWGRTFVLAVTLLPLLVFGRLVIELRGNRLHWHYGYLGWPRWHLAIGDIVDIQLTRGPSMHAGIQSNGKQRVFTASLASPAVELSLRDGRRVLLGSPEPERLAQFIRVRRPQQR